MFENEFVITASGNDDYYLVKRQTNKESACSDLLAIIEMKVVPKESLFQLGFETNF